jgi:hypothetical protein
MERPVEPKPPRETVGEDVPIAERLALDAELPEKTLPDLGTLPLETTAAELLARPIRIPALVE